MSPTDFLGALAVADESGSEVVRRICPKHGRYEFHPTVCRSREVECPKCAVADAKDRRRAPKPSPRSPE